MSEIDSRVLIVDDEKTNITILWEALQSDYIVQAAKSGQQALDLIYKSLPDLILLDISMPEMDGYEVCRRLKESETTSHIPVIFITSKADQEDEAKGLALGAVDYITKPFNGAIVKARVKTHLDLKAYRDELQALVIKRTRELEKKSVDLEETNTALNVLLNKKDEAQKQFEEKIVEEIQDLVLPYLSKMKTTKQQEALDSYIEIIQSNLGNFAESFAVSIQSKSYNLTPMELEIANFIRDGKSTKEIANLMNLAMKTVEWHRYNIRDKLGVKNQKVNLSTYLKTLQK